MAKSSSIEKHPCGSRTDVKFLPSLTRVIALTGLVSGHCLGNAVLRLLAIFLAGISLGREGPEFPKTGSGAPCLGVSAGPAGRGTHDHHNPLDDLCPDDRRLFAGVARAYEKDPQVRRIAARWGIPGPVGGRRPVHSLSPDRYIYERHRTRTMAGAICILIFEGQKFCVLGSATPIGRYCTGKPSGGSGRFETDGDF